MKTSNNIHNTSNILNGSSDKYTRDRKELMDILLEGERNGNEAAIVALNTFYWKLKNHENETIYITGRMFNMPHLSYLVYLLKVRKAFMDKNYVWACHELCDTLHFEDVYQKRIKYNILSLIENYMDVR